MKMTPEVEEVTPYIMRVFSLSYIPQAGCIFSIYFLQSIVHPKMATILSLLRGIILNGSFLILFPLLWGANGIWWALFSAELLTTLAAGVCIVTLYRKQPNIKL
jgi:Na+-driven multidrug efflux pump